MGAWGLEVAEAGSARELGARTVPAERALLRQGPGGELRGSQRLLPVLRWAPARAATGLRDCWATGLLGRLGLHATAAAHRAASLRASPQPAKKKTARDPHLALANKSSPLSATYRPAWGLRELNHCSIRSCYSPFPHHRQGSNRCVLRVMLPWRSSRALRRTCGSDRTLPVRSMR